MNKILDSAIAEILLLVIFVFMGTFIAMIFSFGEMKGLSASVELIKQCEAALPRNQACKIIAVPK